MNDSHLASSYRRIFRIVSKDMPNWKEKISIVIDSDDMPGKDNAEKIRNAVRRMGRTIAAIRFMVGESPCNHAKLLQNGDGHGVTLIYRNKGYYHNIGA